MSRMLSKKNEASVGAPVLVIRMDGRETYISLVLAERGVEHVIGAQQELLRGIALLCEARGVQRPSGILVVGGAERFSDSRSVATVANTLAFAWAIPVAVANRLPDVCSAQTLLRSFLQKQTAIRVRYSGKPHITVPRKQKIQQSQTFRKRIAARP